MLFTHDTEQMLSCTADLVNFTATSSSVGTDTNHGTGDGLADRAALDAFIDRWAYTGSITRDAAELREVQALRVRLRAAWSLPVDALAAEVNDLLREAKALPQLVDHDGVGYHVHAVDPEQPLAVRIAVEFAMAAIDVIRAGELDRLRVCEQDDCDDVLVDLSRNRSKRFCGTACGNRANVAAYRARRRG